MSLLPAVNCVWRRERKTIWLVGWLVIINKDGRARQPVSQSTAFYHRIDNRYSAAVVAANRHTHNGEAGCCCCFLLFPCPTDGFTTKTPIWTAAFAAGLACFVGRNKHDDVMNGAEAKFGERKEKKKRRTRMSGKGERGRRRRNIQPTTNNKSSKGRNEWRNE